MWPYMHVTEKENRDGITYTNFLKLNYLWKYDEYTKLVTNRYFKTFQIQEIEQGHLFQKAILLLHPFLSIKYKSRPKKQLDMVH